MTLILPRGLNKALFVVPLRHMVKTTLLFLLECVPMVVFYVASYHYDFITSTLLYVYVTIAVVTIMLLYQKRLPALSLIFGFFVIVSGLLTFFGNTPDIIIFSDTVYFLLGAAVLYRSRTWSKSLLERLFGQSFDLLPTGWQVMTWFWFSIFLVAGITNEIVRHTMTDEWWIGFQFWRSIIIVILAFCLFPVCRRYRNPLTTTPWGVRVTTK